MSSSEKKTPPTLLRAGERGAELQFQHPLNPHSEIHGWQLSRQTGLGRTAVNLIRVPPGKESYAYHSHEAEEEWLYILEGRAIAEIGDAEYEVGPGDFMGFPTPSVAHHLRNPFDRDVVYLCGGEIVELEIADFPRLDLRMIRNGPRADVVAYDAIRKVR